MTDQLRTKSALQSPSEGTIIWACRTRALQINRHSHPLHCQSTLDKLQVCVLVYSIVALVLLKQIAELVHVQLMEGIEFLVRWLLIPLHRNWLSNCGEGTKWRTTHSESVYVLILQYLWCYWRTVTLKLNGLVMFTVIDTVAQNPQKYAVSAVTTICMYCTTKRFTHLLYGWVFYKAWDQRSTGKCHARGRGAGRYPWCFAAFPVSTEARFLLSFPLDQTLRSPQKRRPAPDEHWKSRYF